MITSPQNEKLKQVRRLAGRRAREREGLFVTEGEDLAGMGLAAGAAPRFLLHPDGTEPLGEFDSEPVDPGLLKDVSDLGSGTRLIGVWPQTWADPEGPVCVYLDGVRDPGNVGTIIRTAHAFVEGSVVIGTDTADPYSPKAVRASMGSIFARPPARAPLGATPSPRIAVVAHEDRLPAGMRSIGALPEPPLTVCIGSERRGIRPEALAECEAAFAIPLRADGPESLNAAVAAAICCERVSSPFVSASHG